MSEKSYFIKGAIDPGFVAEQISKHSSKHSIGGHSIFLGQVRADEHDGSAVKCIEYSAYEEMANTEISKIREAAFSKRSLSCLHIYHSLGQVNVGEISLFVFVSSKHRKEAIAAMTELVEEVKYKVPIWKKEILNDQNERWIE
jgi:molybdopterin synthase catalytic subunit